MVGPTMAGMPMVPQGQLPDRVIDGPRSVEGGRARGGFRAVLTPVPSRLTVASLVSSAQKVMAGSAKR